METKTLEDQTHPRIGGEYLVQCKDTGDVATAPRKVIAFDFEKGTGRTYVWCMQQGGRTTSAMGGRTTFVMEEMDWIPARSKRAILAKAMHAAGLYKGQREVILAAFNEMQLIEGEPRE